MMQALAPILFAIAGLASIASLADSALKFRKAWRALMESKPYD